MTTEGDVIPRFKLLLIGDGGAGKTVIKLQQRAGGVGDRRLGEAAHLEDELGEIGEFVFVRRDDVFVQRGHGALILCRVSRYGR